MAQARIPIPGAKDAPGVLDLTAAVAKGMADKGTDSLIVGELATELRAVAAKVAAAKAAHTAGLAVADFELPPTLPAFIEVMKNEDAEDNPRLIRLLEAIKRAQPVAYRELAQFVAEVMDENSKLWR
jgi:riboflavin synthase